jgi:PD-(D/E)XK nuclease superfamily protein
MLRIASASSAAMEFGTHAHKALEGWYRAWQAGEDRLSAAFDAIDSIECDEIDRIRLRVLVAAYDARWGAEDWEVLAVEVEFRYFLGDIEIGGKIDALIKERSSGRVYVVEHKTSTADTSPGSPYWDRLAIDTQVSIYIDGASFGLGHEISGCVYDVLKRPQHELKLATPAESRRYTLGKGCSKCGGSAGGKKGILQGRGFYEVVFASEVKHNKCEGCNGTGWKVNDDGVPQAPRLDARQRETDETLEEYEERLTEEISQRVDDFLARSIVVRLDTELPRMRQELVDSVRSMQALEAASLHPPNHDACVRGREVCSFFSACSGRADINDPHVFPRGEAHSELSTAA